MYFLTDLVICTIDTFAFTVLLAKVVNHENEKAPFEKFKMSQQYNLSSRAGYVNAFTS